MYYIKGLVNGRYFRDGVVDKWMSGPEYATGFGTVSDAASVLSRSAVDLGRVEIVRVDIVSQETVVS